MENLAKVLTASRAHSAPVRKSANDSFYNAVQAAAAQQLQNQALQNAGMIGAVGLGAGAAGRGISGLVQLIRRNMNKPKRNYPASIPVDMPLGQEEEPKMAGATDFLRGDYAQSVKGVPWAIPAAVGAGAAGLGAGWSAMDYLLDKRRKGDLDAELERAKMEYEAALTANSHKQAADGSLAADLDKLYDAVKEANEKKANSWTDMAGQGAGLYGVYAGASGLGAAYLAYQWDKKRQRRALIDKALKDRRKKRFSSQPAAMYVRPTQNKPTVSPSMSSAPPLEETEGLDI